MGFDEHKIGSKIVHTINLNPLLETVHKSITAVYSLLLINCS